MVIKFHFFNRYDVQRQFSVHICSVLKLNNVNNFHEIYEKQ
jgi:hypothetical protein